MSIISIDDTKFREIYLKYKLIFLPVSVGIASIVILAFVVVPQFMSYLKMRGEIGDIKKHTTALEAKAIELDSINEEDTKHKLQIVLTVLPTDQDVPSAAAMLQDLVTKSGLILQNTSYSGSGKASGKGSFQLSITVSGQVTLVKRFLDNLKDAPQVFQVESLTTTFHPGGTVEAQMPISVFYEAVPGSVSNLDQPIAKLNDKEEQLVADLGNVLQQMQHEALAQMASPSANIPLGKIDPFE